MPRGNIENRSLARDLEARTFLSGIVESSFGRFQWNRSFEMTHLMGFAKKPLL